MSQDRFHFRDVNASLGKPARGHGQFSSAADLIGHLDRLGVGQALVSHVSARDTNPTWGNRELLAALNREPGASHRLVPVFVAGAATLREKTALAELTSNLKTRVSRALRLFPRSLNHKLEYLFPLLESLHDLSPVILIDFEELPHAEELGAAAARFPKFTFICTRVAWADLPGVYDLLTRHANVCIDTSWLHTCGTIEDIVEKFGCHRLIFGLGPRSNAGASIAGLIDAQISFEDRAAIAGENIAQLLNLPPVAATEPATNRFWPRFLRSSRIGLDIIDAHGHLGPVGTWMLPCQQIEPQMADITARMERINIRTMIVSGTHALFGDCLAGNRLLEESVQTSKYFRGYLVFNPHHGESLLPHIEDFFSRDFFVGFKLLSSYWAVPVTDSRYEPVWRHADRHRLPILLHTWSDDFDLPMMLDEIAAKYQGAFFLLGHSGGTDAGRASALELAQRHQNVYLEWCGSYRMNQPYEELITMLGPGRIVFGTDAALHSPAWELGRFLSLDLPDEMLIPALGENMRRILASRAR